MQEPLNLAAIFLKHVSVHVAVQEDAAGLEDLLRHAWETGRRQWPQLALPAEPFVRHLAQRLPEKEAGKPLAQVLERVELADIYLVCACVHDVPMAVEAIDDHYIKTLARRLKGPAALLDDVVQEVRMQLLLGTPETKARLCTYAGRSKLQSWINSVSLRIAKHVGASQRETPVDDVLAAIEAMPSPDPSPELDLIKRHYHREFEQALREAVNELPGEQKLLLRMSRTSSTVEMGRMLKRDQSTVWRWLNDARQTVEEGTKRRLKERLRLSSQEFKSLINVIWSRFELTLSQILGEENDGKKDDGKKDG